jgi:hypothetical protein
MTETTGLATKNLATEELNAEWFISKCDREQTIWQVAAEHGTQGCWRKWGSGVKTESRFQR